MNIAITGATGMVGQALAKSLATAGHTVLSISRQANAGPRSVRWNPAAGEIERDKLEGVDAVVHLAGESIATGRWTAAKKARIRDSRVQGTRVLCEAMAKLNRPPRALVSASAIGYYGDRGEESLSESALLGTGFLPEVCRDWETATQPAEAAGVRVVQLRIGVVLSRQGGALASMLLPFKLGAGGIVGHGRQYWSWITLVDLVRAIEFALTRETLRGPVNAVSPQAATNLEFTKALGRVLRRPTILPLPGFAARLVLGEMATALLLASARVVPEKLQSAGFTFQHPTLEPALRAALE